MFNQTNSGQKKRVFIGLFALFIIALLIYSRPKTTPSQPDEIRMNEHTQQNVQFFTQVKGSKQNVTVEFSFTFGNKQMPISIGYQTAAGRFQEFLVFHPQVSLLDWPTVRDKGLTLMQKTVGFLTIDEFMQNPPQAGIVIDQYVKDNYPDFPGVLLTPELDLENVDYIFTSHAPLQLANNTFYYQNTINAEDASEDADKQMTWLIRVPQATETERFFLSNIHVEYISQ